MATRRKLPPLVSRKLENKVPNTDPRDRELTDYNPKTGVDIPSLEVHLIDELMEAAPPGTWTSEPERIVAGWLERNDIPFTPQEAFQGGRLPGGSVVDFVITLRQPYIALRVQSHWHEHPSAKFRDDVSRAQIQAAGFVVADVWEHEARDYETLDRRMWNILLGI